MWSLTLCDRLSWPECFPCIRKIGFQTPVNPDRPISFKQVAAVPLPNARQQVWMSWVPCFLMYIYIGVHVPCNLINGYMYTHSYAALIHLTWLLSLENIELSRGNTETQPPPPLPRAHSATQTYRCTVIDDVNYRPYTFVIVPFNGSNLEQSQCRLQHEHSSLQSVFQHILFRCQTVLHVPRNELLYHQRFQWHMM